MHGGGAGGGARGVAVLGWGCSGVVPAGGGAAQGWDAGLQAIEPTLDTAVTQGALIVAPRAGTLRNFWSHSNVAMGAGITIACTVRINHANTPITFQYAGAVQVLGSDVANSAVVAAGDLIAVGLTRVAGVPPAARIGFTLELV